MNKIAFFLLIFFFCTAVGLYVGAKSIPEIGDTNPMTGTSVDDPMGSLFFLVVVLIGTGTLLLVLKYYKGNLLFRIFEVYVIFIGSMVVWQYVLFDVFNAAPFTIGQAEYVISFLIASILTVVIRFVKRTYIVLNITLCLAIAGAGGVLGSFMGIVPALLMMAALGTYDIIAVFKTKHMITLADQSRLRQMPVMFETSSKGIKTGPRKQSSVSGLGSSKEDKGRKTEDSEDTIGLGTGDIAIPLVFFVGILRSFNNWFLVGGAVLGAALGLFLTIYYVTQVKRVALPALPPILGMSFIGFGLSFLTQNFL
jgi:presenilin-like A22 family membrane protease